MGGLTEETIKKLKVNELKAELSKRGLAVKGKKDDLVNRLMEAIEEDGDDGEDVIPTGDEEPMEDDDSQDSAVGTSQEVDSEAESSESVPVEEEESKVPDSSCDIDEENVTEDYVVVSKPAEDATEEIEKISVAQDAVVEEQEVTEGTGEAPEGAPMEETAEEVPQDEEVTEGTGESEAPMEVPETSTEEVTQSTNETETEADGSKVEMVSSSDKEPETKTSKDSPRKSKDDKEEVKNGDKEKEKKDIDKDKKKEEKEVKKEPEIVDVLSTVEDEEGESQEEFEIPEGGVALDPYVNDINFVITGNGTGGHTLSKNGFHYMWAGARANKGARGGKVGYELKVISAIPTTLPTTEAPINGVRIGWSSEFSSLALGESSLSYGFESTGKVCASSSFFEYGGKFGEGDVIGTYLDLESEPKTLRYTKNGEDLGVAMSLTINLVEKPLFPHVYIRNMKVELNFGENEEPWFPTLEDYVLIQNSDTEKIADRAGEAPSDFSESEALLVVGLPCSGKTTWVKKYVETHSKKHFNVIGLKQVLDRCKLEGRSRKKTDSTAEDLHKAAITVLTKMYQLFPKRKRNYIFDQNNVYKIAQETKMSAFSAFKKKAVMIVPLHENLRKRTSDSKRRGDNLVDIPFGDLCDMKCEFHLPEEGEFFDEIMYVELDEKNTGKTIRDYHSDGSRAKRTGRDPESASKRKRYEEQRSGFDQRRDRYSGGGGGGRYDSWKGSSGGGYGGYDKSRSQYGGGGGGGYGGSHGGYNKPSSKPYNSDPYRRNSAGGGGGGYNSDPYRRNSGSGNQSGGGGGYRGNNNYNAYGGSGGGGYGNQGWGNNQYQNQNSQNQWSSGGTWGGGYNNSYKNSGSYRGGGGHSY